jgi:plastocyanin
MEVDMDIIRYQIFNKPHLQRIFMSIIAILIVTGCQTAVVESTPTITEREPIQTPTDTAVLTEVAVTATVAEATPTEPIPTATQTEIVPPTPTNDGTDTDNDTSERATQTINISDFLYNPQNLTIQVGTTVIWRNVGDLPHTVSADDGLFDSGIINSGSSFEITFTESGEFPYYCALHGGPGQVGMAGLITVIDD